MTNELKKRIITSIILIAIVLNCLFINNYSWLLLLSIVSFICWFEFINLVKRIWKTKTMIILPIILSFLFLCLFVYTAYRFRIEAGEHEVLFVLGICIFSDIGGYSSMIARNEKAALQLLDEHDIILKKHIKDGNGNIVKYIDQGPLPVNLLESLTQNAKPGEVFAFISYGGRQGFSSHIRNRESASPMPTFRYLLSEKERWDLVNYIQSINN